jgi:putative molybdopterin biosynthesis protein
MEQKEFHEVVSIEEAKRRLYAHYSPTPVVEEIRLDEALGRVLAETIIAPIDVPPFDRAAMDGYALIAKDTFYADEENPVELEILDYIKAGDNKQVTVERGCCVGIATGAPIPKGANAVVMVEYTDRVDNRLRVYRPVAPGENIMAAGADIMRGETAVRKGTLISPRETGVLAALGIEKVRVFKKPLVGVISTGDEIIAPGSKLEYGRIYDVNARAICDGVVENGGEAKFLGIVRDDPRELLKKLEEMMDYDIIITSGGTSAGVGDLSYKVIDELGEPGIIVHGIAVKPGKPTVIGVARGKPIFGLPGYPTSAMVIFDVFVAPLIRKLAGLGERERKKLKAKAAIRLFSAKGRFEYMLMNLVAGTRGGYSAYPILTGSGAITTLAEADGYLEIPENVEIIPEGSEVEVTLLSEMIKPADLTIIGSHCVGVDMLLNILNKYEPMQAKIINVGSSGGLAAVRRGESDISGTHLIDEETGEYNIPFLKRLGVEDKAYLVRGYDREQGLLVARGNPKGISGVGDLLRDDVSFINRNAGSGTRVLLDMELKKLASKERVDFNDMVKGIKGYEIEAKSHTAIAAAVAYGKADVGLAIKTVAEQYELDFIPLREEKYDFAIPKDKIQKPSVQKFIDILGSKEFREKLRATPGLKANSETGKVIYEPI